jgi:low temperature requirement protein LtrA
MGIFAFFFLFIGILMILVGSYAAEEKWATQTLWNGAMNLLIGAGFVFAIWGFGKRNITAHAAAISLYFIIILRYIFTGVSDVKSLNNPIMISLVIICVIILFYLSRRNVREYFRPPKRRKTLDRSESFK